MKRSEALVKAKSRSLNYSQAKKCINDVRLQRKHDLGFGQVSMLGGFYKTLPSDLYSLSLALGGE
jgi:hypothetical protein